MSSPSSPALQRLDHLDKSSHDFHDQLCNVIYGEEYVESAPHLQHDDAMWLVDYLDTVLDGLDPPSPGFRKCLCVLRSECGTRAILPTSYTVSSDLLNIDPEPFASGGYGDVYKGTLDGLRVCIKRVRMYTRDGPQKVARTFCQEAIMWKHLTHPNIVSLLGVTPAPFQLISNWMSGGDLPEYIENNSDADLLGLLYDVVNGLCYLHSCNVIHGDLKGPNILVDDSGNARIADFGLATVTQNLDSIQSASCQRGHTARWAAPEVLKGGTYSKEADIFSFAMVMIEVFTGKIPFSDLEDVATIFALGQGKRPPRPTHPSFTENLWMLTQRCWDDDPHSRPEASEVLTTLLTLDLPAWTRLISYSLSVEERIPLITSIFSDREEVEVIKSFPGDDAQSFINMIDETLDSLAPEIQRRCLRYLSRICDHQSLLPKSMTAPLNYTPPTAPLYAGEFSDVWKLKYRGQVVALKISKASMSDPKQAGKIRIQRFYRGVVIWKTLHHPNILPLSRVAMAYNQLTMVSEWMEDGNINQFVKAHLDVDRVELLKDVAKGLAYMHDRGTVHGDLKGSNILIKNDGHACLAGFRLLTIIPDELTPDPSSDVVERVDSEQWSAPEILKGGGISKKADIFSFAMVVIEVFTGTTPFSDVRPTAAAVAITQGRRPQRPGHACVTGRLWRIIQRCWDHNPQLRPEASEVLETLVDSNPPAWKRLISPTVSMNERIGLIKSIFSDHDEVEVFNCLSGGDAQAFVDTIDKALDSLDILPPETRRCCLRASYRICGREALLPKSLPIPLCYDPMEAPQYCDGFTDMWKGRYKDQEVAAKVLKLRKTSDLNQIRKCFCKEVMKWKTLRHPNLLPLLGVTMSEDPLWFVMVSAWMENGNIIQFLKRVDADRLKLLGDVTRGLTYMHDRGIVHGNLNGVNIMIDKTGRAVLAGFGLVALIPDQFTFLSTCLESGIIPRMSPELLDPEKFCLQNRRPTIESDCYALGMVIYEVLSGQAPFSTYNSFATIFKVLNGERPERPQGEAGKLFTDGIWDIVERCWKTEPKERASAKAVLACLEGNSLKSDGDDDQSDTGSMVSSDSSEAMSYFSADNMSILF